MKELSIEEKAKRYDEAIEKFDVILNLNTVKKSGTIFADDVRKILPELKESDDERMIQYFKDLAPFDKADELYEKYGFSHKDAIAWLEKQGEQKPAWSEEDEAILDGILTFIPDKEQKDWLKSLRPQKQQQEDEQPEYSFIESTYRCGKKPRWNIGDTLAYYEFTSDCEGEIVLGKITNVELDEDIEDWFYTFEDGYKCNEESLLSDETYKKN